MRDSFFLAASITFGSLVIGASVIAAQFVPRYQFVASNSGDNGTLMLRMETRSGIIEYCYPQKDDSPFNSLESPKSFAVLVQCHPRFAALMFEPRTLAYLPKTMTGVRRKALRRA